MMTFILPCHGVQFLEPGMRGSTGSRNCTPWTGGMNGEGNETVVSMVDMYGSEIALSIVAVCANETLLSTMDLAACLGTRHCYQWIKVHTRHCYQRI